MGPRDKREDDTGWVEPGVLASNSCHVSCGSSTGEARRRSNAATGFTKTAGCVGWRGSVVLSSADAGTSNLATPLEDREMAVKQNPGLRRAAIVSPVRTPIGKFQGSGATMAVR